MGGESGYTPSASRDSTTIAVLIASHNRKEHTLTCLERLHAMGLPGIHLKIILVDDGSTDGTAGAVAMAYPFVELINGSGDLFWGGGMRLAFDHAAPTRPDFLLWLNDDVVLDSDAIIRLLATHASLCVEQKALSIVVGSTRDLQTGDRTYGGVQRLSRLRRMAFSPVAPTDAPQLCETMNGNIVLLPRSVYSTVGNVDKRFTHAMADFDYGLRARSFGCQVFVAPGYLGTCSLNSQDGTFRDTSLTHRERMRHALTTKGLPPREWVALCRRYGGPLWPALALAPYGRLIAGRRR
jgi:GT2 family glycosyltransferase